MMSDEEIVAEVVRHPAQLVVLTGGEPSLWIDRQLVDRLHDAGRRVAIETNGTRTIPDNIDWVCCSPKEGAEVVLTHIDELKVVYQGQALEQYDRYETKNRFLQPCSNSNVQETVACVLKNPTWRLSLQIQCVLGIR
jgi:organic radical activating enzyme